MLGVPVAEATQWEQLERGADGGSGVCAHLERLAAQGELLSQDDTAVRIVSLMEENSQAQAHAEAMGVSRAKERTGMDTTALVVKVGERTLCLYDASRAHAGENLAALLSKREVDQGTPCVMSEALSRNEADEKTLIRCHGLAPGRRTCRALEDVVPHECAVVLESLTQVCDHDEEARVKRRSPQERLASHQE